MPTINFNSDSELVARDLCSIRGDRLLFEDLDLRIVGGELMQVTGTNGAGKTTLLRILCGLTRATEGDVLWRGRPIYRAGSDYPSQSHYIGHLPGVKLELTPLENLRVSAILETAAGEVHLDAALDRVKLLAFRDEPCRTLSAGQRRRVALARLFLVETPVWILDEPYTSLDPDGIAIVDGIIAGHLDACGLVIMTSHQPVQVPGYTPRELHLTG